MIPTPSQLRWMKAIQDFYDRDHWYPGADDLMESMGISSANAVVEMVERLMKYGWAEWPIFPKRHDRRHSGGARIHHRANSIRLTPLGLSALKEHCANNQP